MIRLIMTTWIDLAILGDPEYTKKYIGDYKKKEQWNDLSNAIYDSRKDFKRMFDNCKDWKSLVDLSKKALSPSALEMSFELKSVGQKLEIEEQTSINIEAQKAIEAQKNNGLNKGEK